MREYVKHSLKESYRVILATDGLAGLEKIKQLKPDLIISDQMMPKMTGTELCKVVKSMEETSTTPFLLLTAKAAREDIVFGYNEGVDDYLLKPFNSSELILKIHAQLRLKSMLLELGNLAKNEALSRVINFTKHHVNNPLTIVKVSSTRIKKSINDSHVNDKNVEGMIEKLDRAVKRITDIVASLDKDSKIEL